MKKNHFSTVLLALVALLSAQTRTYAQHQKPRRESHFVLATDPVDWSKGRANLCASGFILHKIALCARAAFQAGESVQNDFLVQSAQTGWSAEARLYPFGGPRQVTGMFGKKGIGCPSFSSLWKKEGSRPSPLAGFYLAPGFAKMHQNLEFTPQFVAQTPAFTYEIMQNSVTLAVGFDIHIWRFTVGFRAQTTMGQARWKGPIDIFGNSLNQINFPFKMNVANHLGLSVGVNF